MHFNISVIEWVNLIALILRSYCAHSVALLSWSCSCRDIKLKDSEMIGVVYDTIGMDGFVSKIKVLFISAGLMRNDLLVRDDSSKGNEHL